MPSGSSDTWLDAAAAVRHAVMFTDGVADVPRSAAFQTCGRGQAVQGVTLDVGPDGAARLAVAVVVEAGDGAPPLSAVSRLVRTAAEAAWARVGLRDGTDAPVPLTVAVHLVDVANAPPV